MEIRTLQPGDEAVLEAFLLPRLESSMFLLGNTRAAGLVDQGQRYQGTYAAAFASGSLVGVVAHYWQGNLVFQSPDHAQALSRTAIRASGRPVRGLLGPSAQVGAALPDLDIPEEAVQLDETEELFSLSLQELVMPPALASGQLLGRRAEPRDLPLVTDWHAGFAAEALGEEDSPRRRRQLRASVERMMREGRLWILEDGGEPVATSAFNATIPEAVQVGGVWTPPELRSRGYGRAVVAASLRDARSEGVRQAILFTGQGNMPAQKAYAALGFRKAGDYRMILLRAG